MVTDRISHEVFRLERKYNEPDPLALLCVPAKAFL